MGKTLGTAFSSYGALLRDPVFIGLSVVCGFGLATFFVFYWQRALCVHRIFRPDTHAIQPVFCPECGVIFRYEPADGAPRRARFGLVPLILWSVTAVAAVMLLLAVTTLWVDSLVLMMTLLFIGFGFLGLLLPASGVLALEDHGAVAGSASALLGAIQMITGAVSMTLVGVFADHTPAPMIIGIAMCAVAAMLTVIWTLRRLPAHLASAPPSS